MRGEVLEYFEGKCVSAELSDIVLSSMRVAISRIGRESFAGHESIIQRFFAARVFNDTSIVMSGNRLTRTIHADDRIKSVESRRGMFLVTGEVMGERGWTTYRLDRLLD